ncbi:peptidase metallopeptidase [Methylobacterium sp. DB1607]|nr:peptidase metallopeptidase [Methylobacterium sp. DB1607]
MADLTTGQRDELTFLTGIDGNGAIAANTYFTWSVGEDLGRAWLSKFNNDGNGVVRSASSPAGTGGGTVTYAFASGLSEQEKVAYAAALNLWSDVANIQFRQTDSIASAGIRFDPTNEGAGITFVPSNGASDTGKGVTAIPSQNSPNTRGGQLHISINAPDQNFNSFSPDAAYTLSTVIHETGHALGLGHAGRYNGADFSAQSGVYDSQLWSVMSYVKPDDTAGAFNALSPVKGTNWSTNNSGEVYGLHSQTPMMLDILGMQRIYGASTSNTFAGGQTYGFNTNIAGTSRQFYDFTNNLDPVLTIYNRGIGNTLDVSGFRTNSTINLAPGTFSSASENGTLVNNIGIAFDTRIDKAIGGSGNDTFFTNGNGNTIDGGSGSDTVFLAGAASDFAISRGPDGATLAVNKLTGATDRLTNIETIEFSGPPVCFTTGTRIALMRDGGPVEVPVECLRVGDIALTAGGGRRVIRWIGHRHLGSPDRPIAPDQAPIRIRTGAFGWNGEGHPRPRRDLLLSPGHPVLIEAADGSEALVPILCLINGTTIRRETVTDIAYWHVELDAHDILLAEGLAAESYLDGGDRSFFAEASDHALHNPDFIPPGWRGRCRAVHFEGPLVEAERIRLNAVFAYRLEQACLWSTNALAAPST